MVSCTGAACFFLGARSCKGHGQGDSALGGAWWQVAQISEVDPLGSRKCGDIETSWPTQESATAQLELVRTSCCPMRVIRTLSTVCMFSCSYVLNTVCINSLSSHSNQMSRLGCTTPAPSPFSY